MNFIRWIAFLPVAYVSSTAVYLLTGWASVKYPWWWILIFFPLFGIPAGLGGIMSALVAPNRKVGGYLFAGLVILGELFEAPKMITDWPGFLIFWRVVADVIMISTALKVAASSKDLKVEA